MKKRKVLHQCISLLLTMVMILSISVTSVTAATLVAEEELNTGGVDPIEVYAEPIDEMTETGEPTVTAKPYNSRIRSYITPSIPGYSNYGYE